MNENAQDSFVFYRSFYDAMKKMTKKSFTALMYAICEYALNGEEIELHGQESIFFDLIKPQIDANKRRRTAGNKGGAPKGNKNATKQSKQPTVDFCDNSKQPNVNVNVNVNENENENVNEREAQNQNLTLTLSDGQNEYAKQVFDVFKNNSLPCSPFVQFLQGDFMRALRTLHSRYKDYSLSSSDVIQACKNYVAVLNDPGDYFDRAMPFDRFVEHPSFKDFLPNAFVKSNWRRFSKDASAPTPPKTETPPATENCPTCNKKTLVWLDEKQVYSCEHCKQKFSAEKINPWILQFNKSYKGA